MKKQIINEMEKSLTNLESSNMSNKLKAEALYSAIERLVHEEASDWANEYINMINMTSEEFDKFYNDTIKKEKRKHLKVVKEDEDATN